MAGIAYKVIEIFTSEQARWKGTPLYDAIVRMVAQEKSAARCIVTRAVAGCFENGEVASHRVLDLSHNMPLKIEIILPGPELDRILDRLETMITDGIVAVQEQDIRLHRTTGGLLPRGLLVRDVMTVSPVSVSVDEDLRHVVSVLVRSEFDGVPVTDGEGRLVGLITQDDLMEKVGMHVKPALLAALWRGAEIDAASYSELLEGQTGSLRAGDIMTRGLSTVGIDAPLADAVKGMVKGNLKRLPVLDANGRLVGMLARIDVLRVASAGSSRRRVLESYGGTVAGATPVSHANLLVVPTVPPDAPAQGVLDLIDREGQRVVVLDAGGAPLGVISDRDLLPLLDPKNERKTRGLTAESLMRAAPSISQDASVEEALEWMVEHSRKRLSVVDEKGRYVGMLSREELLRILAPETETG